MIPRITFFQHFHNGDLFTSKEYVRQVKKELPNFTIDYLHYGHEKVLQDLNVPLIGTPDCLGYKNKQSPEFIEDGNRLFVNTWNSIFYKKNPKLKEELGNGINLNKLHVQWLNIFNTINLKFGVNLTLKEKEYYIPRIDFSFFDTEFIDAYLKTYPNKKILICNGEVHSGQSFTGKMENVISHLAINNPNILFFCTEKLNLNFTNVIYSDDIFGSKITLSSWTGNKCDLNEIAYLSKYCDIIVGRNSGPFIFSLIQDNIHNPHKVFVSFNKIENDSLEKNITHLSKYIWSNNYNFDNVINIIQHEIILKYNE